MFTATSAMRQNHLSPPSEENKAHDVIETRLWLEEHDWLYRLLRSEDIVNEQGRVQVGKGLGSGENPDCSGFSIAQLQSLDFAAMDLSEFYASIVPTLPSVGTIQGSNASRLTTCYYGQGKCQ